MSDFLESAPSAEVVFARTYSRRKDDGSRENFEEAMLRTVDDISRIGKFTPEEYALVKEQALAQHSFPSGRAFWVAGTEWSKQPKNFYGYYNCSNVHVEDIEAFGIMMDLAMQGTGTGAILEQEVVSKLPKVTRKLILKKITDVGTRAGNPDTYTHLSDGVMIITVGDSREGWRKAYMNLLRQATTPLKSKPLDVYINLKQVRPSGTKLKGFGGTANPVKLPEMFGKIINILNGAVGRQLTPVECCLIIDEAAACVVAGNIRRSAGMRQFSKEDQEAANAKLGLYRQDENGKWSVDPVKEALRMANHTRCYHTKPSYEEVEAAVRLQFQSGEGAIQYVPEAIARANVDILSDKTSKQMFLDAYTNEGRDAARQLLNSIHQAFTDNPLTVKELDHRMDRYGLNPCAEIISRDFMCNLAEVHLNTIDPSDVKGQENAFYAAGLQVAALLQHEFTHERLQYSRSIDPIVGVSFTGLWDHLVHSYGSEWLEWMMDGCPDGDQRKKFRDGMITKFVTWRAAAHRGVENYCKKHGLRIPNRITTVQPAGTKSLLTGASSGWHPPKAQRFIRRITLGVRDPLVPALIEHGYSVIPAQSARDEEGNLLDDIADPRVHEVLVEIPTEVSWANLPGCDKFDLAKLPIEAQWELYMLVQQCYCDHNTSATLEIRENEIETLAKLIYENIQADGGYISAALLARFDVDGGTFPRLPFEPIDKDTYEALRLPIQIVQADDTRNLLEILKKYDSSDWSIETVSGCANAACVAKADADERERML